jgi:hypothetical protein
VKGIESEREVVGERFQESRPFLLDQLGHCVQLDVGSPFVYRPDFGVPVKFFKTGVFDEAHSSHPIDALGSDLLCQFWKKTTHISQNPNSSQKPRMTNHHASLLKNSDQLIRQEKVL